MSPRKKQPPKPPRPIVLTKQKALRLPPGLLSEIDRVTDLVRAAKVSGKAGAWLDGEQVTSAWVMRSAIELGLTIISKRGHSKLGLAWAPKRVMRPSDSRLAGVGPTIEREPEVDLPPGPTSPAAEQVVIAQMREAEAARAALEAARAEIAEAEAELAALAEEEAAIAAEPPVEPSLDERLAAALRGDSTPAPETTSPIVGSIVSPNWSLESGGRWPR